MRSCRDAGGGTADCAVSFVNEECASNNCAGVCAAQP
jgi:hypothetical protein